MMFSVTFLTKPSLIFRRHCKFDRSIYPRFIPECCFLTSALLLSGEKIRTSRPEPRQHLVLTEICTWNSTLSKPPTKKFTVGHNLDKSGRSADWSSKAQKFKRLVNAANFSLRKHVHRSGIEKRICQIHVYFRKANLWPGDFCH